MTDVVHVAAAVVTNQTGEIFIALRPEDKHQGGLWEFPGGKVEPGEAVLDALTRELHEELGIAVKHARPFIRIAHRYSDKSVLLDVWRVDQFEGVPHGREGQKTAWVKAGQLIDYTFPAANQPIVMACQLPDRYLITPEPTDRSVFLQQLDESLADGIKLIQLRAKSLSDAEYTALAREVLQRCQFHGARLLLNADPVVLADVSADGIHLSSHRLMALTKRPVADDVWVAASCHNKVELRHAVKIGVDFVVLSPVQRTLSHPDTTPLGWDQAHALTDEMPIPVYFLGGMRSSDLSQVFACGGQGIAAIRSLWGREINKVNQTC